MTDQDNVTRVPGPGGLSPPAAKLIELLSKTEKVVLTDEEMTACCGRSTVVGGGGYPVLGTAIRRCEREHGRVWRRDRGANCIKLLDPDGTIDEGKRLRRHVNKQSKRGIRVLNTVTIEALDDGKRTELLAGLAVFGAMRLASESKTQKKLEARSVAEAPSADRLLAAFTNGAM